MADIKMSEMAADDAIGGSEKLLALEGTTSKTIATSTLAAYAVDTLSAAAAAIPASGDKLVAFRGGDEKLEDLDAVAAYAVASGWTAASSLTPVASGDQVQVNRAGAIYKADLDTLKTYLLAGIQASTLDISGLSAATLSGTDQLLITQGSTAKKTTLADLETKLWTDRLAYVSALTAATAGADADRIPVLQGGEEKTITLAQLADYVEEEVKAGVLDAAWDADEADAAVTGDMLVLDRDGVRKTITVDTIGQYAVDTLGGRSAISPLTTGDNLVVYRNGTAGLGSIDDVSDFVLADAWNAATVTTLVAGDTILLGRSGVANQITVANLAAGVRGDVLNISGLTAATLGATDQLLVTQGTTAKKTTLAALETKLFADTVSHIEGLTAVTTVADTDVFHTIQGGTEKKVTPAELATYMATAIGPGIIGTAFDSAAVTSITSGDLLLLERTGVRKTGTVDQVAAYASSVLAGSDEVDPLLTGDKLLLYRGGEAKLGDIDALATYVTPAILASAAVTTTLDTDTVILGRSGATKQITFANLQTEILDGIQATVLDISGLDAATLGAADELLVCQSGVATKTTLSSLETKLWADFGVYVGGLTDAATVIDTDKFYLLNGTTPKVATGAELATYVGGQLWGATAAVASVTGDSLLMYRPETGMMQVTVDLVKDFVTAGIQADTLNLSELEEASIVPSDLVLICQGGVARQASVEDLTAEVHGKLAAYVAARDAVSLLADADTLFVLQAGVPKRVTLSELVDYVVNETEEPGWTTIAASKYTATPASTSTITMSDTSDLAVGLPVRYTYNNLAYYGIVTSIAANASITIAGAPLDLGHPITELCVGAANRVEQVDLHVAGVWDDAVQDLLATVESRYFKWQRGRAYLVAFSATQHGVDSGAAQPYLNVKVNGNLVSTAESNKGIQLSAVAGAWVDHPAVALSTAYYAIARGQSIELRCTQAGTTGDAAGLTVSLVFVYE